MATRRRSRLPADVAAHLYGHGRLLAAAPLSPPLPGADVGPAEWAVATTDAVGVVAADGVRWQRAWVDVDHGTWEAEAATLTLRWVDGASDDVLALPSAAARPFAEAVRDRVQASVVHVERLSIPGAGDVRAVIRRTADGRLMSQLLAEGRRPLTDADRAAAVALEARARQAVGLEA